MRILFSRTFYQIPILNFFSFIHGLVTHLGGVYVSHFDGKSTKTLSILMKLGSNSNTFRHIRPDKQVDILRKLVG